MTQQAGMSELQVVDSTEPTDTTEDSAVESLLSRWEEPADDAGKDEPEAVEDDADEQPQEAEEDDDDESDDQEPDEESEEASYESIDQIAEALGLSTDDFLAKIKTKAKVDGEELEVTLSELRNGYQREADYTRKTQQVAELRKAVEQQQQEHQTRTEQAHRELAQLTQLNEQSLMAEYQSIDWNRLRAEDPAEWSARQQEYQAKHAQIQQWKQYASQQWELQQQQQAQKQRETMQQLLAREAKALTEKIPEWKDPQKYASERTAVAEYLAQNGYQENEINSLADHRAVALVRKAYLYDQMQSKTKAAKKQVSKLPPVLKPGAKKGNVKAEKRQALADKLRKTGSAQAAEDLLFDRLN